MSILSEIGAWLLGIGGDTLNFFKAAILSIASNPQLQTIAMNAVTSAENLAITGVEKQANAYSSIAGSLAEAGLPVIQSQINLAIETAVASLKPAAPATPTAAAAGVAGNAVAGSQTSDAPSATTAASGSATSSAS